MMTDVVVVGAGFGGLGVALGLAERGLRVSIHEALAYPGGCASTFTRRGWRFDAGATISAGLGPEGHFGRWIQQHGLPVQVAWTDPVLVLRGPGIELPLWRSRERTRAQLEAMPDAPVAGLRGWWAEVDRVAAPLWRLFHNERLLPPFDLSAVWAHLRALPAWAGLLPSFGQTLGARLRAHGVDGFAPLRLLVDYLCQITVQCPADEADSLFALAAIDHVWQGTGHLHGGVGTLAEALLQAARDQGAEVHLADRVIAVDREGEGWRVVSRRGEVRCRHLVLNLLPADAAALAGLPRPAALQDPVDQGWGAVMLYRGLPPDPGASAAHVMCVGDPARPLWEGNHTLFSVSAGDEARGPNGGRVVTASTHVRLDRLRADPAATAAAVQARMREVLALRAPEISDPTVELTASPRTFGRFVRREAVGGPARRRRWTMALELGPVQLAPGLWLVGDSLLPGQSMLSTAIGGARTAEAIRRRLR